MCRDRRIMRELHRIYTAALRERPEVVAIALNLGKRNRRGNDGLAGKGISSLNLPSTGGKIANDIAHVCFWDRNLDRHNRLHQNWRRAFDSELERLPSGDFEGDRFGVDRMHLSVIDGHSNIRHGVARNHTLLHHTTHALLNGRDIRLRDSSANDFVFVFQTDAWLCWLDAKMDLTELACAAGLLLVTVLRGVTLRHGLAIRHLGYTSFQMDAKLSRTSNGNVNVNIAHSFQNRLMGGWVLPPLEGRLLFRQAAKRRPHLGGVCLSCGSDRNSIDGLRELRNVHSHGLCFVAQCVAGHSVREFSSPSNTARVQCVDRKLLFTAEHIKRTESLFFTARMVVV